MKDMDRKVSFLETEIANLEKRLLQYAVTLVFTLLTLAITGMRVFGVTFSEEAPALELFSHFSIWNDSPLDIHSMISDVPSTASKSMNPPPLLDEETAITLHSKTTSS